MGSSRKPRRNSSPTLLAAVAASLETAIAPGDHLVLGLSGGVDSMVLLDALDRLAPRLKFSFEALHVNHQLSRSAGTWSRFCRAVCASRGVRLRVVRVEVARVNSVERAAREARYAALLAAKADRVVLAHSRDDQAETLLLNLLRGAGVRGLSAMPVARELPVPGTAGPRSIVRPLLEVTRAEVERYARRRRLDWIDDESNADAAYTRNWLRHDIVPRIAARVPQLRDTLARTARHMGEAAALLDDLARLDLERALAGRALSAAVLRELPPARARNLLRYVLAANGWRMPDTDALHEGLRQVLRARRDAAPAVRLGECELRRHGDAIHVVAVRPRTSLTAPIAWRGERELALPALGGVLRMQPDRGVGLSAERLRQAPVTIRERQGGERLQPHARRPHRTVKNLLQEAGVAPWVRERLPFIFSGEVLACVPGVAIDWRFRAALGEASIVPHWRETGGPAPVNAALEVDVGQSPAKKNRANLPTFSAETGVRRTIGDKS